MPVSYTHLDVYKRQKRMQKADEIQKEQPFAMLVEPKEVFLDDFYQKMEEFIQINDIIDCYLVEENAVVLVDYKSDRLWQEDACLLYTSSGRIV